MLGTMKSFKAPPPSPVDEVPPEEDDLHDAVHAAARRSIEWGEWERRIVTGQAASSAKLIATGSGRIATEIIPVPVHQTSVEEVAAAGRALAPVDEAPVEEASDSKKGRTSRLSELSNRYNQFAKKAHLTSYHPDAHRANRGGKYLQTIMLTIVFVQLLAIWYAVAIFFPPELQSNRATHGIFWTDGALMRINGTDSVCPKESLCSVGWDQIGLLMLSRLTAFVMYITIGLVFLTKCKPSAGAEPLPLFLLPSFLPVSHATCAAIADRRTT